VAESGNAGGRIGLGVVQIAIALGIYLWASNHSPHMGFFATVTTAIDSYIIKEPTYSIILVIAAILGVLGIIAVVRGLQTARG